MTIEQILQDEIKQSQRWMDIEKEESTYKRDLKKRVELINWVLENTKNTDAAICELMESKMNEMILS